MRSRDDPKRPKIVPRRPQDGLISTFLSLHFLHRFFVVFWFDFGAIWEGFGEPKSVILGIIFWMIFACASKIAPRAPQEAPKTAPGGPKSVQEAPQSVPIAPQEAPRAPPKRPKTSKKVPNKEIIRKIENSCFFHSKR